MLRALRLSSYMAAPVRSRSTNGVRVHVMSRRYENTVATEPAKGRSVFGTLATLTLVAAAGYGGVVYYALHDPRFHDLFVTYTPGGDRVIEWVKDMQANGDVKRYRDQAIQFKDQSAELAAQVKDAATQVKDAATNAYEYAQDTYHNWAGDAAKDRLSTVSKTASSSQKTSPSPSATAETVVAKADIVNPIVMSSLTLQHSTVRGLSRLLSELSEILNEAGLADKGRVLVKDAEHQLKTLQGEYDRIETEQAVILKSLIALKDKAGMVSSKTDALKDEATTKIQSAHTVAAQNVAVQEAALNQQANRQREEIDALYKNKLEADLTAQYEQLAREREDALARQSAEIKEEFMRQAKLLVEQERAGRLDKLDQVYQRFKALEAPMAQNADRLDHSQQIHYVHTSVDALKKTLNEARHKHPFVAELNALQRSVHNDALLVAVLDTLDPSLAKDGVETTTTLAERFDGVANQVRHVSLVPEDGGLGSHIISYVMSMFMFKKSGLVRGDDVESILARTQFYLSVDDLDNAARELNQLGGWPKRLVQDWLEATRRHLELRQALEIAETQAVLSSLLEA